MTLFLIQRLPVSPVEQVRHTAGPGVRGLGEAEDESEGRDPLPGVPRPRPQQSSEPGSDNPPD